MGANLSDINILIRREIEARIAGPLIKEFITELGHDKTLSAVNRVIRSLARESGVRLAKQMGGNSLADFAKGLSAWAADDAYEMELLELSDSKYFFNIKRCRYADMYKELGMAELGVVLSCSRDFELVKGFNPRMKLIRTKTIMEGHNCCDFRITLE
jgi:predicted ArsR family transcriptional regulator